MPSAQRCHRTATGQDKMMNEAKTKRREGGRELFAVFPDLISTGPVILHYRTVFHIFIRNK